MLCRAADSPLMKNKTPFFFYSSLFVLLVVFFLVVVVVVVVRTHCSLSILFSRSLFLVSIITLHTHTHTHTHTYYSSTSSGLFASPSLVVYVFFTTISTSDRYSSILLKKIQYNISFF